MFEKIITPSTIDPSPDIWQQPYIIGDQTRLGDPRFNEARWEVRPNDLPKYQIIGVSDTKLSTVTQANASYEPTNSYFLKNDTVDSVATLLHCSSRET